jgi:hypothetical protein
MTASGSAQVPSLSTSLAVLNLKNRATLGANENTNSARRTLRKNQLISFAVAASLGFQRPSWWLDVHKNLLVKLSRVQNPSECSP